MRAQELFFGSLYFFCSFDLYLGGVDPPPPLPISRSERP